jgi:hypothetical protein
MRNVVASFVVVLAASGCGSESPGEPTGPVELVRIMVQDSLPNGVRGVAMDLLDDASSPLTTAVSCDDSHPCISDYLLQRIEPDVSCSPAGKCTDPLAAGLAPLTPPERHALGEAGGTQIRLVFNKLLPASVPANMVVEIDDPSGPVAGTTVWDPSGSPVASSDLIITPYGPALVFKPNAPLLASTAYTIKVNSALVTDRSGDPMADLHGTVVSGTYTKQFTTENLLLLPETTATNVAGSTAVTLTPDEIVQLGFNAPATAAAACTVTMGGAPVAVASSGDPGPSATNCANADATLVNVVAVDGTGAAMDWAVGDYAISCSISPVGGGAPVTVTGAFTVAGTAQANDPLSRTQHAVCP